MAILIIGILILILLIIILVILLWGKSQKPVLEQLREYEKRLDRSDLALRDDFSRSREEIQKSARESREELNNTFINFSNMLEGKLQSLIELVENSARINREDLSQSLNAFKEDYSSSMREFNEAQQEKFRELTAKQAEMTRSAQELWVNFSTMLEGKLKSLMELTDNSAKTNREELTQSLRSFEETYSANVRGFNQVQQEKFRELTAKQAEMTRSTQELFDKIRESVERKLLDIQQDNSLKLEKIRETVDEKLHQTLENRLGDSFKIVSDRLELVQRGLGEMHTLAAGVGDLKKVLSNVKTRGVLGEYQLGNLLEQILTPDQYGQNVKTKEGSNDMVEFAVKLPSKEDNARILWLPVDAKFPSEDYEKLVTAYDAGNVEDIDRYKKDLERRIKSFAKDIKTKYVDPPHTTDFALMFLPFESLYAEVLRIPHLFESIQREYKITLTGPTTLSAFLSSLQMGFRSLAVERRTSEIWEILGAVRTEFGKFGETLQKTKEKLESAGKELEKAGTRSRVIERKLRDVQTLPNAQTLLEDEDLFL